MDPDRARPAGELPNEDAELVDLLTAVLASPP